MRYVVAVCGHEGHHAKGMCKSCYDKWWKRENPSSRSVNIRVSLEDHDEVVRFARDRGLTRAEAFRLLVTWGLEEARDGVQAGSCDGRVGAQVGGRRSAGSGGSPSTRKERAAHPDEGQRRRRTR